MAGKLIQEKKKKTTTKDLCGREKNLISGESPIGKDNMDMGAGATTREAHGHSLRDQPAIQLSVWHRCQARDRGGDPRGGSQKAPSSVPWRTEDMGITPSA